MSKLVSPVSAVVELVTPPKEGQYGPYRSVLFKSADGQKIWKSFDPDSPELEALTPRTKVRLIPNGQTRNGKPSHVVELLETNTQAPSTGMSNMLKHEIASYTSEMAALYRFCYSEASRELAEYEASEETIRCMASSLFIAAQQRFQL